MASYDEKLQDLAALSDEDLKGLEAEIVSAFDEADNADDLDTMSAAADALDTVRAELSNRGETPSNDEDAAPEEQIAEATEPVAADGLPPQFRKKKGDGEDDPDAPPPTGSGDGPETPVEAEITAEDEDELNRKKAGATVASAEVNENEENTVEIPEDRQPVVASAAVAVVAGADIPHKSAGTEFHSSDELSRAFQSRMQSLRGVRGGDGEQLVVASVQASAAPADRTLIQGDLEGNARKVREATDIRTIMASASPEEIEAITASGGYCAPLEVRYDIFGFGSADRPIRDGLAAFRAERGGIRYTEPPLLGDYETAVGLWTPATDADPLGATKARMKVECVPEQTAVVDAVTLQLEFGNLMSRAFPELITRHNELGLITHARLAEQTLLSKIGALSTAVTAGRTLGYARDFLSQVGRAATAYRSRHRIPRTTPLRLIAPAWVLDAMREDLAMGLPGDKLSWADAEITGFFRERNVVVTWHLEQAFGPQAAGVLNDWPTSFTWNLFSEGTFLVLDGGTLDLGIVRDSELVSTNDYITFYEIFEGVAKVGIEALQVTTTTAVTGYVSSTHDPLAAPEPTV